MSHFTPQRQSDYIFLKARQCGTGRRQYLFDMMPKLAEIYRHDSTAHTVLTVLEMDSTEEAFFNIIEQIVLQNIESHKMLLSAIEQGFRPQESK